MQKKNFIVVFGKDNTRIITGINPKDFQGVEGVVVNPDLSKVIGLPPHAWKLENSEVIPGDAKEPTSTHIKYSVKANNNHYLALVIITFLIALLVKHLPI